MVRKLTFVAVMSVVGVGSVVGQTSLSLVGYGTGGDGVDSLTFPGLNVQYVKDDRPYFDFSWIKGSESKLLRDFSAIDVGYTFVIGRSIVPPPMTMPLSLTTFVGLNRSFVCPDLEENKDGCSDDDFEEDWASFGILFGNPSVNSWKYGLKVYVATEDGGVLERGDADVEATVMNTNLFNRKYSFRANYRFRRHGDSGGEGYLESLYPRITLMFGKVF